jgi:hypothetical protein
MEGPTATGKITKHGRAPDYTVEWENNDLQERTISCKG